MSEACSLSLAAPPRVATRRLLIAAGLSMIVFGAVLVVPAVCLETIGQALRLSYEPRGLLLSARMLALIFSLLIVGQIGEGPHKRHYMFWGWITMAGAQIWGALSHSYASLLAAMILSGLGKGIMEALANPLVAQLQPAAAARALNFINGLFCVGLVAGALTTGWLLAAGYSWRIAFLLWAVPGFFCALLFFTPHYPVPPRSAQAPHAADSLASTTLTFLRLPLFWLLFGAMLLGGGCEAGLTSWAPNFAQKIFGASALGGAGTTAFYGTAMALGRFGSGLLVTRWGALRLMAISALACGLATVSLAAAPNIATAYLLFALGGLFVACFWPTLLAVASERIAAGATALFSLLAAAGVSGCVLFPWLIGRLGDLVGLRSAMLVLPASMAMLLLLLGAIALLRQSQRLS